MLSIWPIIRWSRPRGLLDGAGRLSASGSEAMGSRCPGYAKPVRGDAAVMSRKDDHHAALPSRLAAGLWLAALISGLHFFSLTFSRPIFPLLAADLGASEALIGLLTSAAYLLPLFIALPAGALLGRFGVRHMAVFGSVCLVVGNGAYAVAQGFAVLAAARVLTGLAQVIVLLAVQAYVAELGRGSQQDRNFATIFFFAGVGQMAGPMLAGLLARELGMRFAFGAAAAFGLLPLLICWRLPGLAPAGHAPRANRPIATAAGVRPAPPTGHHSGLRWEGIRHLLRTPGVRLGVGASLIMLLAEGARESFFPLYAASVGFDEVAVGALMSIHALFSILVQPFAGVLAARIGRTRLLALAMLSGFGGHLAVPLVSGFVPLGLAVALAGVAMGANQPPSMACVADAAPAELRGLAMALRLTGNRVALLASPVLAGWVVTLWGLPAYFYTAAALLMTGSVVMSSLAGRGRIARSE